MAKLWADGDYVSAGDLNDLIGHANLVFPNAAARDAALVGDFAPALGMTVHLLDDGITYKRIRYAGTDYWVPPPGTQLVTVTQTSTQSFASSGTPAQIVNMTTIVGGRNFGGWWASDKFTPMIPGIFELEGGITFTQNGGGDGYRAAWLGINGATTNAAILGSWNQQTYSGSPSGVYSTTATRTINYFLPANGAYVTLVGMHSSATGQGTMKDNAYGVSSFSAKYLGF